MKSPKAWLALAAFSLLAIIFDIICMCGLIEGYPGNLMALIALIIVFGSSLFNYWYKNRHGQGR